jgi:hypothetical protein
VQAGYYAAPEIAALRQENAQPRRQWRDLVTQVKTIRTKLDGNTLTASGKPAGRSAMASQWSSPASRGLSRCPELIKILAGVSGDLDPNFGRWFAPHRLDHP